MGYSIFNINFMFNYSYEELLNKIFTLEVIKDYSLDKVRRGYFLLWNPLKNIKVIHIAWTNWKGSVSKMVFSILKILWNECEYLHLHICLI